MSPDEQSQGKALCAEGKHHWHRLEGKGGKTYPAACCRCETSDRLKEGAENAPDSFGQCAQTEVR